MTLTIEPLPAFDDNYIWLVTRPGRRQALVVDPGDDEPVIQALDQRGLELNAILITHKHGDHTGGIRALKARWPHAQVHGPAHEPIPTLDRGHGEGDRLQIATLDLSFEVLEVPGHTEGHLAYFGHGLLFCGDTLFTGGCGRVFSGTFEQLADSLRRLAALPGDTQVHCAHEYTLANLGFAQWVEPHNPALRRRREEAQRLRAASLPTVPSSLAEELATNPFLRTGEPQVIAAAEAWAGHPLTDHRAVFKALRQWKDRDYD